MAPVAATPHPSNYAINYNKSSKDMEGDQMAQEALEDQKDQEDQAAPTNQT